MPLNTLQRVDLAKYSDDFNGMDARLAPRLTSCRAATTTCAQLLARRKASSFLPAQCSASEDSACQNLVAQQQVRRTSHLVHPLRRSVGSHFLGGHASSFPGLDMPPMSPGMAQAAPAQLPSPGMPGGGVGGLGTPSPQTLTPDPFGSQPSPFGSQSPGQATNSPFAASNPAAGQMQQQNPQYGQQPMGAQPGMQAQAQPPMGQQMQQQQPGAVGPQQYAAQPQQQPYGQAGPGQAGVQPPGASGSASTAESKELSSAGEGAPINPASILVPLLVIGMFGGIIMFVCNRNKQPKTDLGGDSASAISDDEESANSDDSSSDDKS
mmetsp:Transcript_46300/g.107724  ORF Transcript_46300/g.107724 Transcript_46300/m.107724 type:complete len:323 (+) Transcript_46300:109-1077(+)